MRKIERKMVECACGCGEKLLNRDKWGQKRKYIYGHNMIGRKYSKEHCRNISEGRKGINHSKKAKKKMSDATIMRYSKGEVFGFKKGKENYSISNGVWNKGLTKETDNRIMKSGLTYKNNYKIGKIKNKFGKNNPFYGKKHTQESIKEIRDARANQNFSFYNSSIELKIQGFLKRLGIEHFTHFCINNIEHSYSSDIFIPSMNLVIECDGDYFHGNTKLFPTEKLNKKQLEQKQRDEFRNKELVEKGYNMLRLWENEIKVMNINQFNNRILQYGRTQQ